MSHARHSKYHSDNLRGSLMMLAAIALLSMMDAGLKELSAHYPPLQVGALRAAASWPLAAAWVASTVGFAALLRVRWPLHLIRGVLGVGMMAMFVFAVRHLPLTTAYTLFFVAPLLITALSALLLGERVGAQRWTAIVLGFTGVLVAMRPTGEGVLTWAGLAILGAATGYSLSAITVRVLGRTDSNQSMVFWLLTFMALGCGALAAPGWVEIQARHWPVIGAIGVVGILGQYAITEAFARGEASIVAPLEYTALVWSVGFDRFVWNVMPDGATWIGAAIIVASGAYLLRQKPPVRPEAQVQP